MKTYKKIDFPVGQIRRFLEPGPAVLVTSAYKGERNIMTMGWHLVLEFSPSLIGCMLSSGEHSFDLVRKTEDDSLSGRWPIHDFGGLAQPPPKI